MCSRRNRTRSVRPSGKYRSIQRTKISEIQTGIFGQMERALSLLRHEMSKKLDTLDTGTLVVHIKQDLRERW